MLSDVAAETSEHEVSDGKGINSLTGTPELDPKDQFFNTIIPTDENLEEA